MRNVVALIYGLLQDHISQHLLTWLSRLTIRTSGGVSVWRCCERSFRWYGGFIGCEAWESTSEIEGKWGCGALIDGFNESR
jgi:hypothetical protein